jgi:hypothetical protein
MTYQADQKATMPLRPLSEQVALEDRAIEKKLQDEDFVLELSQ